MPALLPLFPLSVVLLPATPLPLHIFEDRYKEMMSEVMGANREFGVVLIKDQGIVNIGCTATIERVVQRYKDGRLDLIAVGRRRFRILELNDEKAYLQARVEFFNDDDPADVPAALRDQAIASFQELRKIQDADVVIEPQLTNPQVSFQLAQFINDLDKRQAVLSLRSEKERLQFLLGLLPEYTTRQKLQNLARRVGPLNGHAKHVKNL